MKFIDCDPEHPDAKMVLSRLSKTLLKVIGDSGQSSFEADDVRKSRSVFVVGYDESYPIACGSLRPISEQIVELKRMYAENGTGSFILRALEDRAIDFGYTRVWLSTRIANSRAVLFYQKQGYSQIENYGKYVGRDNSVCFEKEL